VDSLIIAGKTIPPDSRQDIDLPVALLHTQTPMNMPVRIIRGRRDGPRIFISAAIHGDELNGVEIIRRLNQEKALDHLRGTLITIPIVNVFGVIHHSRYLPDRRDLNRSFPGSDRGSLAGRLADLFMTEIVANSTHGIDLHTGALHRENLPHLRVDLRDPEAERLAHTFGVPVIINSDLRDGSLREVAAERGIPMLLYEAGEALRFDELSIRAGVKGILNVMRALDMFPKRSYRQRKQIDSLVARSSVWVRATDSGIFRTFAALGARVAKGEVLGALTSPYGDNSVELCSPVSGIVIGKSKLPLVNEGDALFHIARFQGIKDAAENVESFTESMAAEEPEDPMGEQPII